MPGDRSRLRAIRREAAPCALHGHRGGGPGRFHRRPANRSRRPGSYRPFAPEGVEAAIMHLGSALAMAAMRYQTVLRGANFGGKLHEQGLPEETREKREEIAARLAEAMVRDGMSRELYTEMLGFLG